MLRCCGALRGGGRKQIRRYHRSDRRKSEDQDLFHVWAPDIYMRTIITSVALMSAAAACPFSRRISRAASAVMIEEMRWPPIESFTYANRPL